MFGWARGEDAFVTEVLVIPGRPRSQQQGAASLLLLFRMVRLPTCASAASGGQHYQSHMDDADWGEMPALSAGRKPSSASTLSSELGGLGYDPKIVFAV